jgi:hypothetical protein
MAQGQTQGSTLQQCTNKTITTGPFGNTYKEVEVSPEVVVGGRGGGGCRTQVSTTKLGHRYVITILNRSLRKQYELDYDPHLHRRFDPYYRSTQ